MNVVLVSEIEKLNVEAASKSFNVTVTEELVRGLDGLAEVKWSLN